jgi:hypothetical protein
MNPLEQQSDNEDKKIKAREYMRVYSKKRYHEKKEETEARLLQKKEYYKANKERILARVKETYKSKQGEREAKKVVAFPITTIDITALQHYYYRCLLLDPAAVAKMFIEMGVPDLPESQGL